jgi:hypothetical protein
MATPISSTIEKEPLQVENGPLDVEREALEAKEEVVEVKKPKLTSEDLCYTPIFLLYNNYLVHQNDAQDHGLKNLAKLCLRYNWIPSIHQVDWLIQEANLGDEKHRLNFPAYAFMQEFKFEMFMTASAQQPRLLVGHVDTGGVRLEVWAGWPEMRQSPRASTSAADTVLYNGPRAQGFEYTLKFGPDVRHFIEWVEPLEELYQMSKILEDKPRRSAIQVQNAILLGVARGLLRFPGLMKVAPDMYDELAGSAASDHPEFSERPFDSFDDPTKSPLPQNPYQDALDSIKSGHSPTGGVHICHPPNQQVVCGNKPTKWRAGTQKRKRVDSSDDDSDSE